MAAHNELGEKGETIAVQWFQAQGYIILYRNWRYSHAEVDIIASKNDILHFIEVKARKTEQYGLPEESVGYKKMQMLMKAAEEFLFRFPEWKRIQYDVLSITLRRSSTEFLLIEDVFL